MYPHVYELLTEGNLIWSKFAIFKYVAQMKPKNIPECIFDFKIERGVNVAFVEYITSIVNTSYI